MREFSISYFSEVSAVLTLTEGYRLKATHPMDTVTISDWFHFSGTAPKGDPLLITGDTVADVLAKMADRLYPGARIILERNDNVDEPRKQFFTDFFIAFVIGDYHPASQKYPSDWEHPAGEWLLRHHRKI